MINSIEALPEIPEELRLAAREGRLVPFIGAGASMLAGCPSWDEFARRTFDQLIRGGALNHSQVDQIRSRHLSPRIQLSIARGLAAQHGVPIDYVAAIHPDRRLNDANGRRLYTALARLSRDAIFVTTNYDAWLDYPMDQVPAPESEDPTGSESSPLKRNVIHRVEDFSYHYLGTPNTVIHLHGSLDDPDSMIVTTRDYLNRYRSERDKEGIEKNNTIELLNSLFSREKMILFIGYGLDELEILEFALMKAKSKGISEGQAPRHYILQPYFSHDIEYARHMEAYFERECGIGLLPYLRDDLDYAQLIYVIEHFANQIPISKTLGVQRRLEMERLLDAP